jgi:hypothetical protein
MAVVLLYIGNISSKDCYGNNGQKYQLFSSTCNKRHNVHCQGHHWPAEMHFFQSQLDSNATVDGWAIWPSCTEQTMMDNINRFDINTIYIMSFPCTFSCTNEHSHILNFLKCNKWVKSSKLIISIASNVFYACSLRCASRMLINIAMTNHPV